jgi:hypothetical protein
MHTSSARRDRGVSLVIAASAVIGGQGRSPHPAIDLVRTSGVSTPSARRIRRHRRRPLHLQPYVRNRTAVVSRHFNGLDGVGALVRPDGSRVTRFAPIGPQGPTAQGCAECHNAPSIASGGLAHSSVARDVAGKGLAPSTCAR